MRAVVAAATLSAVLCASGCIGTTPDDRARNALPAVGRPGPQHRPGQPCLLCHSDRGGVGPYFSVAGTVYGLDGVTGIAGAQVILVDATGSEYTATTNAVGNFMVYEGDWRPAFPLSVDVSDGDNIVGMRSPINVEGSCSACHTPQRSETSVGPVEVGAFP